MATNTYMINGVPVLFPFPPYNVQTAYMEKVIECLEGGKNGLLESPTGTGKTLSLLCSTLAWLTIKKKEYEAKVVQLKVELMTKKEDPAEDLLDEFVKLKNRQTNTGVPKVIYASRTHSQISQAIQELKRSGYGHMRAAVIGSRDQLCIHSEVMKETTNAAKTTACRIKMKARLCTPHLRLEKGRQNPEFTEPPILDIEDLVRIGMKNRVCPFFVAKDQVETADIIFMPYNYLLDPKTRASNNIELFNTIIILDEAHNVEKLCEDSASLQIRSSDVATAIADVTAAMKHLDEMENGLGVDLADAAKDFTLDDLASLKEKLLELEVAIDTIVVANAKEGTTFNGDYIFELLSQARIDGSNFKSTMKILDSLIQFLAVIAENSTFGKRGFGLQKLNDLLMIVYSDQADEYQQRVTRCYRVHVEIEEQTKGAGGKDKDGWLSSKLTTTVQSKVVSYWCFSPNFAMKQLLDKQARCIILTSGTLAPMKPLISEMGIPINVQLENPHIVSAEQVLVQVIGQGPDQEALISNYANRNNPKYLQSLGRTILSFVPSIPDGLLVFFPSYPIMEMCQKAWQESGIWSSIQKTKPIFVEPRNKNTFNTTMTDYYQQIKSGTSRGAIFMAVCRGKVSEGLDFANENGRAVIITGLPFPPLLDPRVILKKKYLEVNRSVDNQMLSGDEWYVLEAARAVNQAIGRVIRHRYDYGAILLCDSRFSNPRQQQQLSKWIQGHLKGVNRQSQLGKPMFGRFIGEASRFFKNAEKAFPSVRLQESSGASSWQTPATIKIESKENNRFGFDNMFKAAQAKSSTQVDATDVDYAKSQSISRSQSLFSSYGSQSQNSMGIGGSKDFLARLDNGSRAIDFNRVAKGPPLSQQQQQQQHQDGQKSEAVDPGDPALSQNVRKRKYKMVDNPIREPPPTATEREEERLPDDKFELIKMMKARLPKPMYMKLLGSLRAYNEDMKLPELMAGLCIVFDKPELHFMLKGMRRYIKDHQRSEFDRHLTLNFIK